MSSCCSYMKSVIYILVKNFNVDIYLQLKITINGNLLNQKSKKLGKIGIFKKKKRRIGIGQEIGKNMENRNAWHPGLLSG